MQLVIGNKNYSSWSMRPWLLLTHFGLEFEEIRIALFKEGFKHTLAHYSPSLRVPVLIDDGLTVWDSLAICEYVSETYLEGRGYPTDRMARARCRSYCNEMHSGFMTVRSQLPMNIRARRRVQFGPELENECRRLEQIWTEARGQFGAQGDYLFGEFSIADCMFAPVVMRFTSYGVVLSDTARAYVQTILANPAVQAWCEAAVVEPEVVPDYEIGESLT